MYTIGPTQIGGSGVQVTGDSESWEDGQAPRRTASQPRRLNTFALLQIKESVVPVALGVASLTSQQECWGRIPGLSAQTSSSLSN